MFARRRQRWLQKGDVGEVWASVGLRRGRLRRRGHRFNGLLVARRLHRFTRYAGAQYPAGDALAAAAEKLGQSLSQTAVQAQEQHRVHECVDVRDM